MRKQSVGGLVALVVMLMLAMSAIQAAQAQTFTVLHTFTGRTERTRSEGW